VLLFVCGGAWFVLCLLVQAVFFSWTVIVLIDPPLSLGDVLAVSCGLCWCEFACLLLWWLCLWLVCVICVCMFAGLLVFFVCDLIVCVCVLVCVCVRLHFELASLRLSNIFLRCDLGCWCWVGAGAGLSCCLCVYVVVLGSSFVFWRKPAFLL